MERLDYRGLVTSLINLFIGLAIIILGLRIFFRLFDANPNAGFVEWIYDTSSVLMEPFRGIFSPAVIERGVVLDVSAIFTIIMYAIFGFVLLALLNLIPDGGSRSASRTQKK